MFGLCKSELKKILDKYLGIVNVGVHSNRIFNIAYVDVIMTIVGSLSLAWAMNWNYFRTVVYTFIVGIILHRIFCVRTTVDKLLFPYVNDE